MIQGRSDIINDVGNKLQKNIIIILSTSLAPIPLAYSVLCYGSNGNDLFQPSCTIWGWSEDKGFCAVLP